MSLSRKLASVKEGRAIRLELRQWASEIPIPKRARAVKAAPTTPRAIASMCDLDPSAPVVLPEALLVLLALGVGVADDPVLKPAGMDSGPAVQESEVSQDNVATGGTYM